MNLSEKFKKIKNLYYNLFIKTLDPHSYQDIISNYAKNEEPSLSNEEKKIIFMGDGKILHGGFTDRFRGILTLYFFSKILKKQFYINWNHPFKLEKYLIPNKYNWLISNKEQINYKNSYPLFFFQKDYFFNNTTKRILIYLFVFRKLLCNKQTLHIYTNLFPPKFIISKLYDELFKPSELLEKHLNKCQIEIGNKYWSVSFRFAQLLGDFKDTYGQKLSKRDSINLIKKNIIELRKLLTKLPVGYKCLITSDSSIFLNVITQLNDTRLYIVPGEISHIDISPVNESIILKILIEHSLIKTAKRVYLFQTGDMYNSNFAKFSAIIGNTKFYYHKF